MLKTEKLNPDNHLRILDIEIDVQSGTVWRRGEVIDLPDLSYRLLQSLATSAPAMLSKDELIRAVWGDVVVSDETLMQRVKLLRKALGDDSRNPRFIAAVRGRGYRLAAPVEVVDAEAANEPDRKFGLWKTGALIVLLAITALGLIVATQDSDPEPPSISSLAILPFNDLSEDQRFGYFADGMQEELLARLAGLSEISVLSRTSVERFRDTQQSIPDISEALNADAVIEGSVRVNENRLRITVQLIDGRTDQHLWAESYAEELTVANVFAIQERVASSISEALQAEYRRQRSTAMGLPTTDIDAYNLYLLGRHHTFRQTPQGLQLAVRYLQQAIDRDPQFAEAHTTLGWAYSFLGTYYGQREPRDVYPRAREAALRALELNNQLPDAHSLYADILTWYDWNFELAEAEYRRAVQLEPSGVLGYALFLSSQGRHDEAVALVEERIRAMPENEWYWLNAGWRYFDADRNADAIRAAQRAGNHPDVANLLGKIRMSQGEVEEAIEIFEEDLKRQGRGLMQVGNLAYAYFRAGDADNGQALLDELEAQEDSRFVPSLTLAAIYFAAGDDERGYDRLRSAVEARERGVIFLSNSHQFAEQRDDPRFKLILQRAGIPMESS